MRRWLVVLLWLPGHAQAVPAAHTAAVSHCLLQALHCLC